MRVLCLHNRYREPGGEDAVARAEAGLLRSRGVETIEEGFENDAADGSWMPLAGAAAGGVWSRASYRRVLDLCRVHRPDVVHVHNFWMKLSPSAHAACRRAGVPVVQTLHNFRLLCPNALFLRHGQPCEDCLGKIPWRGVARRCYRGSAAASAAVAAMIGLHRLRGTWRREVGAFIALSEHSRGKFIAGGLPADRIFVKPNFVDDPGTPASRPSGSDVALYAGRLSPEKGLDVLLDAWAQGGLSRRGRLWIAGDGPERERLERRASELGLPPERVRFFGRLPAAEVGVLLRSARCAVLPSRWYEAFPMAVVEAFAHGRPVVASRLGALAEIVADGRNGLTAAGDVRALSEALDRILRDGPLADRLGEAARLDYLAGYTPEASYRALTRIYAFAGRA